MPEFLRLADLHRLDAEFEAGAGRGHPASGLKPGVMSPNAVAAAGTDGYLFISNGANLWERQYLGELSVPAQWLESWNALFARRQAEAGSRGVTLLNLIAPEKQVIYPEKRWPLPLPDGTRRPLKLLQAQLDPAVSLIYPEAELVALKATTPAYPRHNSHWTISGAAVVVDLLLSAASSDVRLADIPLAVDCLRVGQDLTVHFFDPAPEEMAAQAAPPGEVLDDNHAFERTGHYTDSSFRLRHAGAPDQRRVVVFGDSYAYGAGLNALLSAAFAEVLFVWSKDVDWALVQAERADVVIWESAERFLAKMPAN